MTLGELADRHRKAGFPGYNDNHLPVEWDALAAFAAGIDEVALDRMGLLAALFLLGRPERAAVLLAYALQREIDRS